MSATCAICALPEPRAALLQVCMDCGRTYHLNPYRDGDEPNCGDALPGTMESPALQFLCAECIEQYRHAPAATDATDATADAADPARAGDTLPPEVAALLGVPPDMPLPPELAAMLQQLGVGGRPAAPADDAASVDPASEIREAEQEMGLSPEFALLQRLVSDNPPPKGSAIEDLEPPDAGATEPEA